VSLPVAVYDAGMLIALDRKERNAQVLHSLLTERSHPPVVPLAVLAQAWRPGHWTPLSRVLPDCVVFGARGQTAPCGVCIAGHDVQDAKRAGQLLARAGLPEKKRPDAVDALAVIIAARHESTLIVTSDPDDLTAYRDVLPGRSSSMRVLPVAEIADFLAGKKVTR
jgi:hypothetical protein